jgi:hypothetical protein
VINIILQRKNIKNFIETHLTAGTQAWEDNEEIVSFIRESIKSKELKKQSLIALVNELVINSDRAVIENNVGGIDFNAEGLNISEAGKAEQFNISGDFRVDGFEGFTPVVIGVQNVLSINEILVK